MVKIKDIWEQFNMQKDENSNAVAITPEISRELGKKI